MKQYKKRTHTTFKIKTKLGKNGEKWKEQRSQEIEKTQKIVNKYTVKILKDDIKHYITKISLENGSLVTLLYISVIHRLPS